jgi:hypothetical protein
MAKMSKEQRAALNDLKRKVRAMLRDFSREAIAKIDKIEKSGSAIVADHIENGENYATPKDVMCALAKDMAWQYRRLEKTRKNTATIDGYYRNM